MILPVLECSFSDFLREFEKKLGFKNQLKWGRILFTIYYHTFGFYWCYLYAFPAKWQTFIFAIVMYIVSAHAITCGVHRLWSHKSYKARLPLRIYLMMCYTTTGQNSIYSWVRDHRVHHKYSDTDADPHNSKRGFFFSHIGWVMTKKNHLVLEKGRQVDMSDIKSDPVVMFERKYSIPLLIVFCYILPTLTGILLWGETWKCAVAWQCFIRYLTVIHSELAINSFAHMYGNKPYNKHIQPSQNFFVSLFIIGEGWHNYHHTFPNDYKAAEIFDLVNLSALFIRFWAMLGLAYDLKESTPELIQAVANNKGDGSLLKNQEKLCSH